MTAPLKRILGIRFFVGEFSELMERSIGAGLVVVPSAPVLVDLTLDPAHALALRESDFAITDSGYFVILWWLIRGERLPRISGLRYLTGLLGLPAFRNRGATFWIMPSPEDSQANQAWLRKQGLPVDPEDCVVAPRYPSGPIRDPALIAILEARRPAFVVICIGGGVQERLGLHLRRGLTYRPTLICTGAAIAFLSGRQASIPVWADRMILGWFLRLLDSPARLLPRYLKALRLPAVLLGAGQEDPVPPTLPVI